MVIQNLKAVMDKNSGSSTGDYVRNLLKEELQVFVLNYIYTSKYKNLIFTGGTCLRKFYSLPRISEDLDFEIEEASFDFEEFQMDLNSYFSQDLQYKDLETTLKNLTIFLKFPILREIGFSGGNDSEMLFLRLDFSFEKLGNFGTRMQLFSESDFSFVVRSFDLPTLFANKIAAYLTRKYYKGQGQSVAFKGRDVFDVVWMLNQAKKTGLAINMPRIEKIMGINNKEELKRMILDKGTKIGAEDLYNDLKSFFKDDKFVQTFCNIFLDLLRADIVYL